MQRVRLSIATLGWVSATTLLLAMPTYAQGVACDYDATVTPTPGGGVVTIQWGGMWNNSCIPQNPQITVSGNRITLTLTTPQCDMPCLAVITDWCEQASTATLAPGTYDVVTEILCNGGVVQTVDRPAVVIGCPNEADGTQCDTDVTGDCVVNNTDLGELLAAYLSEAGDSDYSPAVDFDNSGRVDNGDLGELLADYLNDCN